MLEEIASDRQALAALTGYAIDGMAYPAACTTAMCAILRNRAECCARTINETKSTPRCRRFFLSVASDRA